MANEINLESLGLVEELGGAQKRKLTDQEMERLCNVALIFCEELSGIKLYPYQREFAWRILWSLMIEDSDEITGLIARQAGKCLAKGTPVMMFDGSIKPVEKVEVGDLLMGDDSTPRKVLSLCSGEEQLWRVQPNSKSHEPYTVNESHILSVVSRHNGKFYDRSVKSILSLKKPEYSVLGYKVPVEFPEKDTFVDPYWLGLWLSDGSSRDTKITVGDIDVEIIEFLREYANRLGLQLSTYYEKGNCNSYAITGGTKSREKNPLKSYLCNNNLILNKHIPMEYKANSKRIRLEVLAGIIDGDRHRPKIASKQNTCEIVSCRKELAKDIQWLARSLGIRASLKPKVVNEKYYWRVCLYGELWKVPTKLPRKQYAKNTLKENPRTYGFTLVDEGVGQYFGFEIDGNKRFLLGDCTVTHNTEALSVVTVGAMILLPILGNIFAGDERLHKFKDGLWAGIYAPNYELAAIMWNRMKLRLYSKTSKQLLLDPSINIDLSLERNDLTLSNGSFVDCGTANPQSKIEGKTYNLILLDETQDISSAQIRGSIHPMGAAVGGTIVKIGTPNRIRSEFYEACRRNKRNDVAQNLLGSKKRTHFEYDYTVVQRYNSRYKKYMDKEKERLGEDSEDFRLKYRLHWLSDKGVFISADLLDECGITNVKEGKLIVRDKRRGAKENYLTFERKPWFVLNDAETEGQVAGIDIGKDVNSTIVAVGKVWWEYPILYGEEYRYYVHIQNFLELLGDDHEAQYPLIYDFLKRYNVGSIMIDATGRGDPIYTRMKYELECFGINVSPFVFTEKSKDIGYKVFLQELTNRRFTFPAGKRAISKKEYVRMYSQMVDLEKFWRGNKMVVHKPKDSKEARDDIPDAFMMLCYLVNINETLEVETDYNPMIGRSARWMTADMIKKSGAWYRGAMNPKSNLGFRGRGRPSKRGKWE